MTIIVNGQNKNFDEKISLATLVENLSPHNPKVITEVNGAIIAAGQWASTELDDGDQVELVTFVGGG